MTWCVDQVQYILTISPLIVHLYRMTLDGDATLSFQIHIVQKLRLHLTVHDSMSGLYESVSQCAFAVIYMGDNAEVANVLHGAKVTSRSGNSSTLSRNAQSNLLYLPR